MYRRAFVHPYTGRAAQAVRRLKYEQVLTHLDEMADELAATAKALGLDENDASVPVPIHWTRQSLRGFNQASLLAQAMPNVVPLLRRTRRTQQQVGLNAEQRRKNLRDAFVADPAVRGLSILLVDDVITSGGTAVECARAILAAGALKVDLLTYCAGGGVSDF